MYAAAPSYPMPGHMPDQGHTPQRQRSLSWRAEAGLPPPPSEIDHYHNLHDALVPSSRSHSPFAYDSQFGGLEASDDALSTNTVSKHPKLKLKIILSGNIYEAGSSISGALEVTSSTSQRLRLGEIAIELEAFEELTSRDHSATQIFLFNRTLFQGEHLPPSNAVLPAAPVHGHWTARKGRTTFPFSFRLPATAPSSVSFAGNANLRYALKGTAQTWWNESKSLVTVRSDAFVVERWHDELDPRYLEPVEAVADTHIFMGGSGAVWLEAGISEQLFAAGTTITFRAGVKNNTKRHLSGLKVAIARRLIFPASGLPGVPAQRPSLEPQITEVVHTQHFKGPAYEFPPSGEVVATLAVELPRDIRTIRKTRLFEVQIVAQICAQMGNFAKDLVVEVPLIVAHSASLQNYSSGALNPLRGLPQRSRSAMGQHGFHNHSSVAPPDHHTYLQHQHQHHHHQHYDPRQHAVVSPSISHDPQMMPIEAYGAERGWSPAPYSGGMGPPSRASSAAANVGATAALPFTFDPGRNGQEPQILMDNQAPGWTGSALMQQLPVRSASAQEFSPRSALSGRDNAGLGVRHSQEVTAGSTHLMADHGRRTSFSGPNTTTGAGGSEAPRKSQLAPSPQLRPIETLQTSTQLSPAFQAPMQMNSTASGITVSQLLSLGAVPILGLSTIEEDSESAAGTVRSLRTLVGSVSRNDVAQFEAMIENAQGRENLDLTSAQDAEPAVDRSLPRIPLISTKDSLKTRPRASDLFEEEASTQTQRPQLANTQAATATRKSTITAPMPTTTPVRPTSAQGQGLTALESRLGTQRANVATTVLKDVGNKQTESQLRSKASPRPAGERRASGLENGALRAAAAEHERKEKQDAGFAPSTLSIEQVKRKTEEKPVNAQQINSPKREDEDARLVEASEGLKRSLRLEQAVSPGKSGKRTSQVDLAKSSSPKAVGERKSVNVEEMRQLNKEAVGRVTGWLSKSPTNSNGIGEKTTDDLATSPKTPSPSVLKSTDDDDDICSIGTSATRTASKDDITPSLSAELRALIDASDARPVPRQGIAIKSNIASRRFYTEASNEDGKRVIAAQKEKNPASQSKVDIPSSASRSILLSRQSSAYIAKNKPLDKAEHAGASSLDDDGSKRYDVRSARGGRGGRVASVANMWASIADGTDGSKIKADDAPVLTLRPKALRSGAGGSSALDFSKPKNEESRKPSAMEIFASPAVKENGSPVMSPPLKTQKAAHFVNTTMPKPTFVKSPTSPSASPLTPAGTRNISVVKEAPAPVEGKLRESRKIVSDAVAQEAKLKAGRNIHEEGGPLMPMNGRGTTRPIGREKLADLRSLWGG